MSTIARAELEQLIRLQLFRRRTARIADPVVAYYHRPADFARECINWPSERELAPYQADTMDLLAEHHRMSLRSLRGAGKSTTAALIVLWFALTRDANGDDWKIITTAGSWGQLINFLWPEIKKWASKMKWDIIRSGRPFSPNELLNLNLKLTHGAASAAASSNPGKFEGAHADQLLYVFDEAKVIPASIFDSAEGALTGSGAYAVMMSTPGEPAGRFYEVQSQKPGYEDWATRVVRLEEVYAAGQVTPEWVEQRKRQWGENSSVFQNHVLGNFFAADEDSVIPLQWAEQAVERWKLWNLGDAESGTPARVEPYGRRVVGVDVARYGTDKTIIARRQGEVFYELQELTQADTLTTTGNVVPHLNVPHATAVVDAVGVGAGVVDQLRGQGRSVLGFSGSGASEGYDKNGIFRFLNLRAESWWRLREALDPANCPTLCLPEDDQLLGDLTSPRWTINSGGKIQVESKDDIRQRLGRSPDRADAVVLGHWRSSVGLGSDVVGWSAVNDGPISERDALAVEHTAPDDGDVVGWEDAGHPW